MFATLREVRCTYRDSLCIFYWTVCGEALLSKIAIDHDGLTVSLSDYSWESSPERINTTLKDQNCTHAHVPRHSHVDWTQTKQCQSVTCLKKKLKRIKSVLDASYPRVFAPFRPMTPRVVQTFHAWMYYWSKIANHQFTKKNGGPSWIFFLNVKIRSDLKSFDSQLICRDAIAL